MAEECVRHIRFNHHLPVVRTPVARTRMFFMLNHNPMQRINQHLCGLIPMCGLIDQHIQYHTTLLVYVDILLVELYPVFDQSHLLIAHHLFIGSVYSNIYRKPCFVQKKYKVFLYMFLSSNSGYLSGIKRMGISAISGFPSETSMDLGDVPWENPWRPWRPWSLTGTPGGPASPSLSHR